MDRGKMFPGDFSSVARGSEAGGYSSLNAEERNFSNVDSHDRMERFVSGIILAHSGARIASLQSVGHFAPRDWPC